MSAEREVVPQGPGAAWFMQEQSALKHQGKHIVSFHLYETSGIGKSEMESRLMVAGAGGWVWGEAGWE